MAGVPSDGPMLTGLGLGDVKSGEGALDDDMDTDDMAAEEVTDDLEAGIGGDREALKRAVRVLMRRE